MSSISFFRVVALYALSVVLLTYYGIEVCPFLERLTPGELALVIGAAFVVAGACRFLILRRLDVSQLAEAVDLQKPWQFLMVDLGAWVLAGLLVTGWNAYRYDFPLGSGLKVVLGCVTLGIFSASHLALEVERSLILCLADEPHGGRRVQPGKFLSISTKFLVFVVLSVSVVAGVLLLLIYKDFQFVVETLSADAPFEFLWIVREMLFVFAVLLLGSFAVARQYSRNLRLMFELQLKTFGAVALGDYETFVPVVSHDEFGLIAENTNQMILGLRERERIKKAFGKYMSPTVADAVLNSEQETHLGGREVMVAILFTDLRDFTPLSEKCSPQEVVALLNAYFTMVVSAVHRHGGVLDKFIGDSAMAVYGLGGREDAHAAAVQTAFDILDGLDLLNRALAEEGRPTLRNGVGVHCGSVVAGNIGSEERLEYTVIGDAVNTAARLESLTKSLPSALAVSADAYNALPPEIQRRMVYLQDYDLKGKAEKMAVYGLADG